MKRILITGASSGLGRALAIALAEAGTHLIVTGRQTDALQSLADEVTRKGAHIDTHVLEMSAPEVVQDFGKAMAAEHPTLDVLINNAAIIKLGRIEQTGVEELDTHYAVNLRAPVILVKGLMESVRKAKGQFVFINSTAGLTAQKGVSYYAAMKYGLKAIADSLREEVSLEGATVLSVFPGRINTPMQMRVLEMEGSTADVDHFLQPDALAITIVRAMELCRRGEVRNISIQAGEEDRTW